jgi:branched-chain amino acid transport system substrate-binding protein
MNIGQQTADIKRGKFVRTEITGILAGVVTSIFLLCASAQAEIKIGIAGPLSGSALPSGEQQEIGVLRAISDLNEKGGVLGQEIVTTSVDDACEPEQAKAVAKQLVSEGVVFVVGHVCSSTSLASSKIYEAAGIIMISPASTNPKVTDEGGPNIFRMIGRDDQQGVVAGDYLANNHGSDKIAIVHDGQAYGQGLAEYTKKQLNSNGVTEILYDSYTADQTDYQSLVDKFVAAKIDVLYAGGYQGDIGIIIRQAKKKLPNLKLLSGDALVSEDFLVIAGEAGNDAYFTFGPDIRLMPEAAQVTASFRDEEGFEPAGYTLYSYGAVQVWAQAVELAGSLKTDAIITALNTNKFDTVLGKIGFDDKGDVTGISSFVWYVFKDENYVLVE